MKFDKRYWIPIALAVFFATVASASTIYLASVNLDFLECNSVTAACFAQIGMVPCMLLGIAVIPPVMVAIPFILRENETPGPLSVLLLGIIVLYTALDAINNVSVIMGFFEAYHAAHTVLSTTNNATGNILGTGESLC